MSSPITPCAKTALVFLGSLSLTASATADHDIEYGKGPLHWAKHIVVIYMENHSFDNLYGTWEPINGAKVNGLSNADAAHTNQIGQFDAPYNCLLQNDPHLTSPSPLATNCQDRTTDTLFNSAFTNQPFQITPYIPVESPTRDLVHRFYQEQYQINDGRQNRYVTGSDAVGLSMGYYDTTTLPIYKYLHSKHAPNYIVLDNFFQGTFGGSFLNHQWLITARAPLFIGAVNDGTSNDLHSVVDANGMPNNYPLYKSPIGVLVKDATLTASCNPPAGRPATPSNVVCGDYAINTIQPKAQPYAPGTAAAKQLPPLTTLTIGDLLTQANIDWAWYSGGWDNAAGNVNGPGWTNGNNGVSCTDPNVIADASYPYCADKLFQFHHQAFNYYAAYAPGTKARARHLRDEEEFIQAAKKGKLKAISFVKPLGEENEHPGYATVSEGSQHLVDLIKAVEDGPNAEHTLIIVTYDEFGGSWDHVPPPGQGGVAGIHDRFGPGTRVPALLVSKRFKNSTVDHTQYDTSSILATIERRFGLKSLGERDNAVEDLSKAVGTVIPK